MRKVTKECQKLEVELIDAKMEAAYLKAKHEDMQNELAKLKRKADMLNNIPVNQTPF